MNKFNKVMCALALGAASMTAASQASAEAYTTILNGGGQMSPWVYDKFVGAFVQSSAYGWAVTVTQTYAGNGHQAKLGTRCTNQSSIVNRSISVTSPTNASEVRLLTQCPTGGSINYARGATTDW